MVLRHDSVTSPNDVSRAKGLQNACRGRCVNAGAFSFKNILGTVLKRFPYMCCNRDKIFKAWFVGYTLYKVGM